MATITLTVTVANPGSGNRYYIDGVLQATVSAIPGNTYKFDQADGTNSGHPLRLSITSNGTHSGGSAYTTGVTTNGTPGSAGAYTQIVVTATTVQALYYYCTNHSNMGGSFNVGSSSTVQYQDQDGFPVQNFSADQTTVGQIYYNSTSGTFKGVIVGGTTNLGTWASGGNLNTAVLGNAGFGTQSAAASVAGTAGSITNHVEEYNGSSWTEVTAVPTGADSMGSCGPQTSGMVFGGQIPPNTTNTFEYDGTNWTSGGALNTARRDLIGAGTQTAGLAAFGAVDPPFSAEAEQYNGSAWTTVAEGNTARRSAGGSGTSTSALAYGGYVGPPGATNAVETWDGSSWTEVAELNTARLGVGSAGSNAEEALAIGGEGVAVTESWNGSSWTEVADLAVARGNKFGLPNGPTSAALQAGGNASGASTATEEFTVPDFEVKTLTTS